MKTLFELKLLTFVTFITTFHMGIISISFLSYFCTYYSMKNWMVAEKLDGKWSRTCTAQLLTTYDINFEILFYYHRPELVLKLANNHYID